MDEKKQNRSPILNAPNLGTKSTKVPMNKSRLHKVGLGWRP
jgi:hypothetical protein